MSSYLTIGGYLIALPNGYYALSSGSGGGAQTLTIIARHLTITAADTFVSPAVWCLAGGGIGPYTYTFAVSGNTPEQSVGFSGYYYFMNSEMNGTASFNTNPTTARAGTTDTLTLMVTDSTNATATTTISITYAAADANVIRIGPDYFYTNIANPNTQFLGIGVALPSYTSDATTSFVEPSGYFTVQWQGVNGGYIIPTSTTTWPPAGVYPITLNISEGDNSLSQIVYVYVIADTSTAFIQFTPAAVLSTSLPSGFVVGQAVCGGDPDNTYAWTVSPTDIFAVSDNGLVTFTGVPTTAGSVAMTLTVADGDQTHSQTFDVDVLQGNVISSANMTADISSDLTNAISSGLLTTPSVTGFTPTQWVLIGKYGIGTRYSIASNGVVSIIGALSYQTAADGTNFDDVLMIIATDGINTCSLNVTVPVAAASGPTVYIIPTDMESPPTVSGAQYPSLTSAFASIGWQNVVAGTTFVVYPSPSRTYYLDDGCDIASGIGCGGQITQIVPLTIMGAPGETFPYFSGSDGAKGFFDGTHFDLTLKNLEIGNVTGYGLSGEPNFCAIYKEASCSSGNITIDNCYIHDSDNGVARGCPGSKIFITNSRVSHCGVGDAGFTHNFYVEADLIYANNILSDTVFDGHVFKTRSQNTIITNSRLYDGMLGSASNIIDLPQGGLSSITNCVLHKGPNGQNPYMIKYADPNDQANIIGSSADGQHNTLTITGCTLILDPGAPGEGNVMGGMATSCAAQTQVYGIVNSSFPGAADGLPAIINGSGNSFYGFLEDNQQAVFNVAGNGTVPAGTNNISGSTVLTTAQRPALDYTFPGPGPDPTIDNPPGPFLETWTGEGGSQIVGPTNVMVVSAGAAAGTVVGTIEWSVGNSGITAPVFALNYQSGPNAFAINSSTGVITLTETAVVDTTQADIIGVTVNATQYVWNFAILVS
jgi:hypothetical protein